MNLLRIENLSIRIQDVLVCEGLTLELAAGQTWAILGRNGIGKTTLLHTLAGLRPAQHGRIYLQDKLLDQMSRHQVAKKLGILLQDELDAFPASVLETVLSGRHPHLGRLQWESQHDLALAEAAMQELELLALKDRPIQELSGGERRRVSLATLLTQDVAVNLLDEPTNHLDLHHQVQVLRLLQQRTRDLPGLTLMSLHDINLACRFCTHGLMLFGNGSVLAGPMTEITRDDKLEALYGHPLNRIHTESGDFFLPG